MAGQNMSDTLIFRQIMFLPSIYLPLLLASASTHEVFNARHLNSHTDVDELGHCSLEMIYMNGNRVLYIHAVVTAVEKQKL